MEKNQVDRLYEVKKNKYKGQNLSMSFLEMLYQEAVEEIMYSEWTRSGADVVVYGRYERSV